MKSPVQSPRQPLTWEFLLSLADYLPTSCQIQKEEVPPLTKHSSAASKFQKTSYPFIHIFLSSLIMRGFALLSYIFSAHSPSSETNMADIDLLSPPIMSISDSPQKLWDSHRVPGLLRWSIHKECRDSQGASFSAILGIVLGYRLKVWAKVVLLTVSNSLMLMCVIQFGFFYPLPIPSPPKERFSYMLHIE